MPTSTAIPKVISDPYVHHFEFRMATEKVTQHRFVQVVNETFTLHPFRVSIFERQIGDAIWFERPRESSQTRNSGLDARYAPANRTPKCHRTRYRNLSHRIQHQGTRALPAAQSLAGRLTEQGLSVRRVLLPGGHDPNSFFVQGGDADQFQSLLEAAQ